MFYRWLVIMLIAGLLPCGICAADTIYLNNGRKVTGKVVMQSDVHVKIDVKGMVLTYFPDEVQRIEYDSGATKTLGPTQDDLKPFMRSEVIYDPEAPPPPAEKAITSE